MRQWKCTKCAKNVLDIFLDDGNQIYIFMTNLNAPILICKVQTQNLNIYLFYSIWFSVLEGMQRCICSFNHSIAEMKGLERNARYSGSGSHQILPLHFISGSRKSHIHAGTAPNCTGVSGFKATCFWGNFSTAVLEKEIFKWKSRSLHCKSNRTLLWTPFNFWNEHIKSPLNESMTILLWSGYRNNLLVSLAVALFAAVPAYIRLFCYWKWKKRQSLVPITAAFRAFQFWKQNAQNQNPLRHSISVSFAASNTQAATAS